MLMRALLPLLLPVLLASCVWPTPKPGEPVPTISTTTQWSAAAQTVTLSVDTTHITPLAVRIYARGKPGEWMKEDFSAPFTFTLDATEFSPGEHELLVMAYNRSTIVADNKIVEIHGCNNFHALCDRSYAQVRYATTHNAMSNAANGWIGPNQALDVPAQLAAGVRGLMLDTYRAGYTNFLGQVQIPEADPDSTWLCHSVCALGKQPLAEGLGEIREFLDNNPGEVITLILESYLSHALEAEAFNAAGLTQYAYTHPGGAWPTLGEMIDSGKRLVVLKNRSANPLYPWQMNVWSHAFDNPFSAAAPTDLSCSGNRGSAGNTLFIMNHFLTQVFGSAELAEQVNFNPLLRNQIELCESFHGTTANFITVDFVSIGDAIQNVNTLNGMGPF